MALYNAMVRYVWKRHSVLLRIAGTPLELLYYNVDGDIKRECLKNKWIR